MILMFINLVISYFRNLNILEISKRNIVLIGVCILFFKYYKMVSGSKFNGKYFIVFFLFRLFKKIVVMVM